MNAPRPLLVNGVLAAIILAAGGGSLLLALPTSTAASAESTQLTGTVQEGTVSSTISASGSVAAVREVAASFAVSGTIATLDVSLGQTVTAGQQLGTLDTTDLATAVTDAANQLASATTQLAAAKADLATAKTATSTSTSTTTAAAQGGSTTSVSSATAQVTSAQSSVNEASAAVTGAETDLASATLLSPIDGLVIAVNGTVGSSSSSSASSSTSSTAGTTTGTTGTTGLVTIADVSQYTLTAGIAEADIADVAVGQTAAISFPALTDTSTTATVTAISPTATTSNSVVTYSTTLTLDSIPDGLRLGQTAEAAITTVSSAENALFVPTAAITTSADGTSTVEIVDTSGDDDTTSEVTVELGVVGDEGTEIVSGLEAGQTVVLGTVAATESEDTMTTTDQTGFGGGGFPSGGGTPPTGTGPGGN